MKGVTISQVNMSARQELGIKPGDTVRVWQKVKEKDGFRLQAFEGLVLAVKHGKEAGGTFTVRKVTSGVGVEKIYPLYSPMIDRIEIVRRAKVRRAKLYYIREKVSRETKRALRRMTLVSVSDKSRSDAGGDGSLTDAAALEAEAAVVAEVSGETVPAGTEDKKE